MRTVVDVVGRTLVWLVTLGALAVITVAVLVPRVAGATPYTILTGSMRPQMPPGTLVVVKPVDPAQLAEGDVVTLQLESGEGQYVTHRIVSVEHRLDGELRFVTQGDANDVADEDLRRPEQVRGERWYSVPYLGYVSTVLTGQQRGTAVTAVASGLLLYAAWMVGGLVRDRRTAGAHREDDRSTKKKSMTGAAS